MVDFRGVPKCHIDALGATDRAPRQEGSVARPRVVHLMVNSGAGRKGGPAQAGRIVREVLTAGESDVRMISGPTWDEVVRLARTALTAGSDALVACGGDGTVSTALEILPRHRGSAERGGRWRPWYALLLRYDLRGPTMFRDVVSLSAGSRTRAGGSRTRGAGSAVVRRGLRSSGVGTSGRGVNLSAEVA